MKWCECLRNKVSYHFYKIYRPYKVLRLLSYSFGSIVYHCIYGCVFCVFLFNSVFYVFLLLCTLRSRYCVSLCCSVYWLCVNVFWLLPSGVNPIAVKNMYHINHIVYHNNHISYHINHIIYHINHIIYQSYHISILSYTNPIIYQSYHISIISYINPIINQSYHISYQSYHITHHISYQSYINHIIYQ